MIQVCASLGRAAAADVRTMLDHSGGGTPTRIATSEHLAVGWTDDPRFITAADDGEVAVVLDGFVHGGPRSNQAHWLLDGYRTRGRAAFASGVLGDFVCVVLDRARHQLCVARDPIGVRPWYLARVGDAWLGSTRAAAVAVADRVDRSLCVATAMRLLAGLRRSDGATLFAGVTTLAPGHTAIVGHAGARVVRHHRLHARVERELQWSEATGRVREAFERALIERVDPRHPPAAELSGGLDSSAIVGWLAKHHGGPLLAGRMVFDDIDGDEREYSDAVIQRWGLACRSSPPWHPTLNELRALAAAAGTAVGDINGVMALSLHRMLRDEQHPYVFSGIGGDDAFAAMPVGARIASALGRGDGAELVAWTRWAGRNPRRLWPGLIRPTAVEVLGRRPPRWPWLDRSAAAAHHIVAEGRARPAARTGDRAIDARWHNLESGHIASIMEGLAALGDVEGYRLSHPYLDPSLIELSYALDPAWPTRRGWDRSVQRDAFGDLYPDNVRRRRSKAEFSALSRAVLTADATADYLRGGKVIDQPWVDRAELAQLIDRAKAGGAGAIRPLAGWLSVELWYERFG